MQTITMDKLKKEITAQDWFSNGKRVVFDTRSKKVLLSRADAKLASELKVFVRTERSDLLNKQSDWVTFLPGFPDGSFGWARVNHLLGDVHQIPGIFMEYIGQGDSDKPTDYPYGTRERADLVEAMWKAYNITSTSVVTFDYSSLVLLELLSRQIERTKKGSQPFTKINRVLIINGGLFADGHSHPWYTTPLLKTPMGKMGVWMAQRSQFAFNQMVKDLWSKEYRVTSHELSQLHKAISRRNGMTFLSRAAGFVDEHQANAERWDLGRIFFALQGSVSFMVAGSDGDPFEPDQIVKARERLGVHGLDIRSLPGGHLTTSEYPELIVGLIQELTGKHI